MKMIIQVARRGAIFNTAAKQVADARNGKAPNFQLSFDSVSTLFSKLTPARLDLMQKIRRVGPCSVRALATETGESISNIGADLSQMQELGLIETSEDSLVSVPFDSVEIQFALARPDARRIESNDILQFR